MDEIITGTLTDGIYQIIGYPHDFTGYILVYIIAGLLLVGTILMFMMPTYYLLFVRKH